MGPLRSSDRRVVVSERVAPAPRLTSVDALRGLVMVIMVLDHTREFFHVGALSFQPDDLTRTTPILFFTRWITHICAPVFMFLAGTSAFLRRQRGDSTRRVAHFLWTRGLWLVVLELTVMRLALNFTVDSRYPVLLLVLWALGLSMVALAGLIYLPVRVLAVVSLSVILLHNTLDRIQAPASGAWGVLWHVLHQPGVFMLGSTPVVVGYPVLPWIAVMAAGFSFGAVLTVERVRRQRWLVVTGWSVVLAFLAVRAVNIYGDPSAWSRQATGVLTVLSFLRTTKYPPSLDFLLMTLGPALLLLAWLERRAPKPDSVLVTIGRVPLFFFVVHFSMVHLLAALMAFVRYGGAAWAFVFSPLPSVGGDRARFPPDFGYPLWVVYVVWCGVVLLMSPLCRAFAALKARRRDWWLSYL